MGVEPTAARSARPATGFEDQGSHRAPTTPNGYRIPLNDKIVNLITTLCQWLNALSPARKPPRIAA